MPTLPGERELDADVLIVGAGMAGLSAASELQKAGRRVVVLDKGRGVGGRLASRRAGGATFDHGAQFITARDPRFAEVLELGRQAGAVEEWCRGFSEGADGHTRWRGTPAMTAVAKHLAAGLEVRLEKEIAAVRCRADRVELETKTGEVFSASAVVLTAPVPQALVLLDAGGTGLSAPMRARLEKIEYERCLAVMAVLYGPSRVPVPGGFAPLNGPVAWIADNQMKGISAGPAVTIHGTPGFSVEHWDRDREESGRLLLEAAAEWLGSGVKSSSVHGWRYSRPLRVEEDACVVLNLTPLLILAGDAFGGPRVEGAALSGWAAAEAILNMQFSDKLEVL